MSQQDVKVADSLPQSWVHRFLPNKYWPYAQLARWERPIGWWLLMWPCWWSLALGLAAVYNPKAVFGMNSDTVLGTLWEFAFYLVLMVIGAMAMRGAGCTYNDLVDEDIDQKVSRTRSRPLPSGRVTRIQAKKFLVGQALVGLLVLLQFNWLTIGLGALSLVTVVVYPFMKRVTWWPQLFLGFAFSWGAWMGWAAMTDSLSWVPLLLYAGCISWVIGYDTIYAHQDIEDDALIGVKSTARLFSGYTKTALSLLYFIALVFWAAAFSYLVHGSFVLKPPTLMYSATLIAVAVHMVWQIWKFREGDGPTSFMLFYSNSSLGWIMFTGLVLAALTS